MDPWACAGESGDDHVSTATKISRVRVGGYLRVPRVMESDGTRRVRVVATKGVWAVTRSFGAAGTDGYTVTHIPTGYAAVTWLTRAKAIKALRVFAGLPGDWSFTDPSQITKQQQRAGKKAIEQFLRGEYR